MADIEAITRKSMLYQTKVEYGDWAMNHVQGCAHGCKYPCYAFLIAKRFKRVSGYDDWCRPRIVSNTIDLLKSELPRYSRKIKQVQLSFTTDPFMYGFPEIAKLSFDSIQLINSYNIPCHVLTKGVLPKGLSGLSKNNHYGVTLITLDEKFRQVVEPGASPIDKRIEALRELSSAGCKTWVSVEPFPTPNIHEDKLEELLDRIAFVDRLVFGRTHYNKIASSYEMADSFYIECASKVREFCEMNGIDCHIKKGTGE